MQQPFATNLNMPQQLSNQIARNKSVYNTTCSQMHRSKLPQDSTSLASLTVRFVELLNSVSISDPHAELDLNVAMKHLGVQKRRLYDVTNVLEGIGLIKKKNKNQVSWAKRKSEPVIQVGGIQGQTQNDISLLKSQSVDLDVHIELLSKQVKDYTLLSQVDNAASSQRKNDSNLYVTKQEVASLQNYANDTVIAIRAPSGTGLEVPNPDDGMRPGMRRFQIYLTSPPNRGQVKVFLVQHGEKKEHNQEQKLSSAQQVTIPTIQQQSLHNNYSSNTTYPIQTQRQNHKSQQETQLPPLLPPPESLHLASRQNNYAYPIQAQHQNPKGQQQVKRKQVESQKSPLLPPPESLHLASRQNSYKSKPLYPTQAHHQIPKGQQKLQRKQVASHIPPLLPPPESLTKYTSLPETKILSHRPKHKQYPKQPKSRKVERSVPQIDNYTMSSRRPLLIQRPNNDHVDRKRKRDPLPLSSNTGIALKKEENQESLSHEAQNNRKEIERSISPLATIGSQKFSFSPSPSDSKKVSTNDPITPSNFCTKLTSQSSFDLFNAPLNSPSLAFLPSPVGLLASPSMTNSGGKCNLQIVGMSTLTNSPFRFSPNFQGDDLSPFYPTPTKFRVENMDSRFECSSRTDSVEKVDRLPPSALF